MIEYLQRKKYLLETQLGTIIMLVGNVIIVSTKDLAGMNISSLFFLTRC